MKKIRKITVRNMFFIVLLLIFACDGFCEDSVNINVSCTVPEIPGINAPLLKNENQIVKAETQEYTLQTDQQAANSEQPMPLIQEDVQEENSTVEERSLTVLVKTFYPR